MLELIPVVNYLYLHIPLDWRLAQQLEQPLQSKLNLLSVLHLVHFGQMEGLYVQVFRSHQLRDLVLDGAGLLEVLDRAVAPERNQRLANIAISSHDAE